MNIQAEKLNKIIQHQWFCLCLIQWGFRKFHRHSHRWSGFEISSSWQWASTVWGKYNILSLVLLKKELIVRSWGCKPGEGSIYAWSLLWGDQPISHTLMTVLVKTINKNSLCFIQEKFTIYSDLNHNWK